MSTAQRYDVKRALLEGQRSFSFSFYLLCILSLFSVVACQRTPDKERFINTYSEILITREMYPDSALGNNKVQEVLRNYGYTQTEFQKDYAEFNRSPQTFRLIMDSVQSRVLQKRQ